MDSLETGPTIEVAIETQDGSNVVTLHDGNVNRVARRHQSRSLSDFTGAQYLGFLYGYDFVDTAQRHLGRRSNGLLIAV